MAEIYQFPQREAVVGGEPVVTNGEQAKIYEFDEEKAKRLGQTAIEATRREEIAAVLDGRSPEYAVQELKEDIEKYREENRQIASEGRTEAGAQQTAHNQERIKALEEKIALIEGMTEAEKAEIEQRLATDVVIEEYADGSRTVTPKAAEMPDEEQYDFYAEQADGADAAAEAQAGVIATAEEMAPEPVVEMAPDMLEPMETSTDRLDLLLEKQALDLLTQRGLLTDEETKAIQTRLEQVKQQITKSSGFARTAPGAKGPTAEEIAALSAGRKAEVVDFADKKAELVRMTQEREDWKERRLGLRNKLKIVGVRALLGLMMMSGVLAGSKLTTAADKKVKEPANRQEAELKPGDETTVEEFEVVDEVRDAGAEAEVKVETQELVGDPERDLGYKSQYGVSYNFDFGYNEKKEGTHGFGPNLSVYAETGDTAGAIAAIRMLNEYQPFQLAATVVEMPGLMAELGLDAQMTAQDLNAKMTRESGGEELRARVAAALDAKLNDTLTHDAMADEPYKTTFYQEYNAEYSYYAKNEDEVGRTGKDRDGNDLVNTPEKMIVKLSLVERHGEWQIKIPIRYYNAAGDVERIEYLDLNMPCGGQTGRGGTLYQNVITTVELAETPTARTQVTPTPSGSTPGSKQPASQQPEGEKPSEEQTDEEEPGEEEQGEEKQEKLKSAANEQRLASGVGTTNEVTQTVQDGEVTEQRELSAEDAEIKAANAQGDNTQTLEEQAAALMAQLQAELNQQTEGMSAEELEAFNQDFEQKVAAKAAEQAAQAVQAAQAAAAESEPAETAETAEAAETAETVVTETPPAETPPVEVVVESENQ